MKSALWVLGICLLLTSCATISVPAEPIKMTFSQPHEKVWSEIVKVLTIENDLPIKVIDKESGLISTDWVTYKRPVKTMSEAFVISSSHSNQSGVRIRFNMNVSVEQAGNETHVVIRDHVEQSYGGDWAVTGERPEKLEKIKADLLERLSPK